MALRSGSLNRNGILETCSRFGIGADVAAGVVGVAAGADGVWLGVVASVDA